MRQLELEGWCSSHVTKTALKDRKNMKRSGYEKVRETSSYIWFTHFRDKGLTISGLILKEKVLQFQIEFNEGDEMGAVEDKVSRIC